MDLKLIEQLIKMVNASALESMELEQDGLSIKLVNRRGGGLPATPFVPDGPTSVFTTSEPTPVAVVDDTSYTYATAPIVGVFKSKEGIDVGTCVSKGDVICVIEAMKLINDIESNASGEIVEILVQDGDQVEFGQKLFKLK